VLCDENCPTCVDSELGPEMPTILTGPHYRRAHSPSVSGKLLGVASFAAYEEDVGAGFGGMGWEDAEGSPDPDFLELSPIVEERHSPDVKVEKDKERSLGLQVELLELPQKATPVTKKASIAPASPNTGYYTRRL